MHGHSLFLHERQLDGSELLYRCCKTVHYRRSLMNLVRPASVTMLFTSTATLLCASCSLQHLQTCSVPFRSKVLSSNLPPSPPPLIQHHSSESTNCTVHHALNAHDLTCDVDSCDTTHKLNLTSDVVNWGHSLTLAHAFQDEANPSSMPLTCGKTISKFLST